MKTTHQKIYCSSEEYLKAEEGLKNEVDMFYTGACIFLQELCKKQNKNRFGGLEKKFGKEVLSKVKKPFVLDVCCGPGNFANYISMVYSNLDLIGIDINWEFVRYAQEKFDPLGWKFIRADARNFHSKKPFDFILASSSYHHIEDDSKITFLENLHRNLTRKGKIIICDNFLPHYSDGFSRIQAVNRYYSSLLDYYQKGGGVSEGIKAIEEAKYLDIHRDTEYKVSFQYFEKNLEESQLKIEEDRKIWQPEAFMGDNAGSHVLLLSKL